MGKIFVYWLAFWSSRKTLFFLVNIAVLAVLINGITKLTITQDIVTNIDGGKQFSAYTNLLNNKGLNQDLIISIKSEEIDFDSLQRIASRFSTEALNQFSPYITTLTHEAPAFDELYDYVYHQLPYFVDTNDLSRRFSNEDYIEQQLSENHSKLLTPEGYFLRNYLFKDPLQLVFPILSSLRENQQQQTISVIDGCYALSDSTIILRGKLSDNFLTSPNKLDVLADMEEWLKYSGDEKSVTVDYFNSGRIALENANQVKKDTLLTLIVSLIIILLLLFSFYKKITIPFFFLIPGSVGVVFSLGLMGYIKPEVTGLSLGAGAVVIGIIMDYSFHFFTHLKHSGSIRDTLLDVAHPLVIGCFTTVLAFGALIFANSSILNDFGLFAGLSLIGTLIGVLLILPIVLPSGWIDTFVAQQRAKKQLKKSFKISKKWGLAIAVVATIVASFGVSKVQFEGDLDALNYYPEHIRVAEQKHTGFISDEDKRLFVAVKGASVEEALLKNEALEQLLKEQRKDSLIKNYISVSSFLFSKKEQQRLWAVWRMFWSGHEEALFRQLEKSSASYDYAETAFNSFKNLIQQRPQDILVADYALTADIYDKLVSQDSTGASILTVITASRAQLGETKSILSQQENIVVLDRSDLAAKMVESVESDFNYILLVSSLIVFIVLLINFGRIELTLVTFLPMILSWLWILGFAGWMDIKFNLVNVVITTFIFGLGDDFAIFVTEGRLNKYRNGSDSMRSFRTGIILSAITTIVGTGVLVLAKHPAIHSIGLISIVGLVSILFISLVVQPLLFDFFILSRTKKKKAPLTLSGFLISIFAFTFFLSGCTIIFVVLMLFKLIPFGQKQLKYTMHHILRAFTWAQVYVMLNVRKKVIDRHNLSFDKPALIIANHQSFIDILAMIMLHPRVVIMTNRWVYNSPFFGAAVRYADYLPASDGYENMLPRIQQLVDDGYSIMIFPEGTRSKTEEIGRFHKGAFFLAQELKLDVQPIVLHGFHFTMSKSDFLLKNGRITIKPLPRIAHDDDFYGTSYAERTKSISRHFKEAYKQLQYEEKDHHYIRPALLLNYLYKSPSLEWYFRIKYRLEGANYDFYNKTIGDRKRIYDLGCGLGFLSYYLFLSNPKRRITGVDYDAEKIDLAEHCYLKNEQLDFIAEPIENIIPEKADAIFLMDVLHYLPENKQLDILNQAVENLLENGIIFIRDGIADDRNHHKNTERTEFFSTKLLGFNKTTADLHFFTRSFIELFAQNNKLSCEIIPQSKTTSNHLFILRK